MKYEEFKHTIALNGTWFLVKPKGRAEVPAVYWKSPIANTGGFYSVNTSNSSVTLRTIKPPTEFIESVNNFNIGDYLKEVGTFDVVRNIESVEPITENTPKEESPNVNVDISKELIFLLNKDSKEYNFSFEEFVSLVGKIDDFKQELTERIISENKKLSLGTIVKLVDEDRKGVIRNIILQDGCIRYVCKLIKKDGTESATLLTTKDGNLFEELIIVE